MMFASQNAQRSDQVRELRQRLRSFIDGTGFETDPQNMAHNLTERLVQLGPISTEEDVPAIARIPWSVFVTRYLGVDDLTAEVIDSAQTNLRAMTAQQCAEVEPLLQEIVELLSQACGDYSEFEGRSYA
jgi:hypothetical protein